MKFDNKKYSPDWKSMTPWTDDHYKSVVVYKLYKCKLYIIILNDLNKLKGCVKNFWYFYIVIFLDMATRRSKSFSRTHGRFSKQCGCLNHELFAGDGGANCLLQTRNESRRLSFQNLVKRNLISLTNKHVCSDCLKYSRENFSETCTLQSSFTEWDVSDLSITNPTLDNSHDSPSGSDFDLPGTDILIDNADDNNIDLTDESSFEHMVDN